MAESRDAAESLGKSEHLLKLSWTPMFKIYLIYIYKHNLILRIENTNKLDSILTPSIKLDIPGESYYLTTFLSSDVEALHEIMQGDSISPYLVSVPHP